MFFVLAYALSPIDLIPDFVPIFGYLDDIIIVPVGISLAIKMIPSEVLSEAHEQAMKNPPRFSTLGKFGIGIVILIWMLAAVSIIWRLYPLLSKISR